MFRPLPLEILESRLVPTSGLLASASGGTVAVSDLETGEFRTDLTPFAGFTGDIDIVLADVNNDAVADLVVGAGAGGGPRVRVYDGATLAPILDFFAFGSDFTGGVSVAAGDFTGDGILEIVVGAGAGGGPHVRAFDAATGAALASFFAFESTFLGGVDVAAVDLTGDGVDEIVAGAGAGGGPRVRGFDVRQGQLAVDFFAYELSFLGGVRVAGADPYGAGLGTILTAPGTGGAPLVRLFGGEVATGEFYAGNPDARDGARLDAFAASGNLRIAVALPDGTTAAYDGATFATLDVAYPGGTVVASARSYLGPVLHGDDPDGTSFVDPTSVLSRIDRISLGMRSYVAPFAVLDATAGSIAIGDGTNVQDNVLLEAGSEGIAIGDHVILAHNASVLGNARVGAVGGAPTFVGFNAVVDGATIEAGAFVNHLSRIAPGITLRAGMKTEVGKFIRTQAEADDPALGKVTAVTSGDVDFMEAVLEVNEAFAAEYPGLFAEGGLTAVSGFGENAGNSNFNPTRTEPTAGDSAPNDPRRHRFRNRILGDVTLGDDLSALSAALGSRDSIRADEGFPFVIGSLGSIGDRTTFHALEHTEIEVGSGLVLGEHVVVHGGADDGNVPSERTQIGDDVQVGDWSVVFRSTVDNGVRIGFRAYVDGSQLAPGTVVPDRAILIRNVLVGFVEW